MNHKEFIDIKSGISFFYPSYWQSEVEEDGTFLFYDEELGSFRVTVVFIKNSDFSIQSYLEEEFNDNIQHSPTWEKIGSLMFLKYKSDAEFEDDTVIHYYVTGCGNLVLYCSYAYDEEFEGNPQLINALEEVERSLQSINI